MNSFPKVHFLIDCLQNKCTFVVISFLNMCVKDKACREIDGLKLP